MLRNVLFASAVLSVSTSLALLAPVYAEDDETKSNAAQQQQKSATSDKDTEGKTSTTREGRSGQNASGQSGQRGAGQGQANTLDHKIATCVALANQEEVALGQIGAKKASHDDVKHFATMLVSDHHEFLTKLEKFAPEASQPGYLDGARQSGQEARSGKGGATQNRSNVQQAAGTDSANSTTKIQQTGGQREGAAGAHAGGDIHAQMAQMEREIAQQCLTSAQEKLADKTGAEFDKCFIGLQIAKHMSMRDKLIVFQRHTSGDLTQLLATGQKKTEEHLAKAEELMKTLEQSGSSSGQSNQNNQNNRNQKGASTNNTNKATDANKSKDNE